VLLCLELVEIDVEMNGAWYFKKGSGLRAQGSGKTFESTVEDLA